MEPSTLIFLYAGASIVGVLFSAYVFAVFFGVKRQLWYQQKQLDILVAMAKKSGIAETEINEIMHTSVN